MKRGVMMGAVAVGLVAMLGSSGASATTRSEDYVWGQGDHVGVCAGEEIEAGVASPVNQGAVCFHWSGSKPNVQVVFNDLLSGGTVGFYWQWFAADGGFVTGSETDPVTGEPEAIFGTGCSPRTLPAPAAARGIRIWLDQAFGPLDCPGNTGVATTGSVTATY